MSALVQSVEIQFRPTSANYSKPQANMYVLQVNTTLERPAGLLLCVQSLRNVRLCYWLWKWETFGNGQPTQHLNPSVYKMEPLITIQMWKGKKKHKLHNHCNQKNTSHRNSILCEVLLCSHYGEKVKISKSCQCSKPSRAVATLWGQLWACNHSFLKFTIFTSTKLPGQFPPELPANCVFPQ